MPWWSRDRLTVALVASHVVVQLVVPLRHFLYPGDVSWTEEGHRFSWHMKLRDKTGDVDFIARNAVTGGTSLVDPHTYLTTWQMAEMKSRPDMILQFCHRVADDLSRTIGPVEIRARAWVSLNGRPAQWLIDPDVDLAEEPRNLWPARWIVPQIEKPSQTLSRRRHHRHRRRARGVPEAPQDFSQRGGMGRGRGV